MRPVKFKAILSKAPADSGWHFIPVEEKIGKRFEKKDGTRRIVCTINGTETFQCALIPWGEIFTIIVNKEKRDRLGIAAGDTIAVVIELDESKYGLPMPEELQEVLNQDPEGDKLFHSLTAGKQRSILYFVGKIKDIDKRIHTALIFIEHIKRNEGKIVQEELTQELKRPAF
ncbi:MAG: DUF1905 domain-containing protein [Pyrinomonadaceae bacterium]